MQKKVGDRLKMIDPPDNLQQTNGAFPPPPETDEYWMALALQQAEMAADKGEVPVGAVLVGREGLLAAAGNSPISLVDPSAHAEIIAIRAAAKLLHNYRLPGTTLYVTLEPCIMCMGAMIQARICRLVYGAPDLKTGAAISCYAIGSDQRLNHTLTVTGGVLADQCGNLLQKFFKDKRNTGAARNSPFLKSS
jgi:tRNA(adenine34) deaminase